MSKALSHNVLERRDQPRRRGRASWTRVWIRGVVLCALVVGTYLAAIGFPAWVRTAIVNRLAAAGYTARIGHLRWSPGRGIVAESVQVSLEMGDQSLWGRADQLVFGTHVRAWRAGRWWYRFQIEGGELRLALPAEGLPGEWLPEIELTEVRLDARRSTEGIQVLHIAGRLWDMPVHGHGQWRTPEPVVPPPPPVDAPEPEWYAAIRWPDKIPDWGKTLLDDLRAIEAEHPPRWSFEFDMKPDEWVASRVALESEARGLIVRGVPFDQWRLRARAADGQVELLEASLRKQDEVLTIEGSVDWAQRQATLRAQGRLAPVYWRNLLPPFLREYKEWARVKLEGPLALSFDSGPLDWDTFGREASGYVEAQKMTLHDVQLEAFSGHYDLYPDRIEVTDMEMRVGQGSGQGPAAGNMTFDWSQGVYHGAVRAQFDARAVLPVAGYSRIAAEIIQDMQFGEVLPEIDVNFSGHIEQPRPQFNFDGVIKGQDFIFGGSWVNAFESTFLVTNRVMRMDPLRIEREEGAVTGWYQQDFNNQWIDLEVESQVDPRALGRLASENVERLINRFRFEGPVDLSIAGRVDYDAHQETDYTVTARAEQVGWRWLLAEEAAGRWEAKGDHITLTNIQARLYGGELTGDLRLTGMQTQAEKPLTYTVTGRVKDVEFPELLRALRQTEDHLETGLLSGRFTFEGPTGLDWREAIKGEGRVRIQEGEIFSVRLLGGLTALLERIYPRLGSVTQTEVRADFEVAERQVLSENIRLEGSLLSLRAWGAYDLDDELDFRVHVQPLRSGWLVDVVRWVTYPVSRLLQFQLEGTLEEPNWRIEHIPRELWSLFERENNDE